MGQVTVRVNGYAHTIGCKDGEEAHVLELIGQIEGKTKLIRSMGGQFSEARMLLHVALLLADEASDLRAEMARMAATGTGARRGGRPAARRAPGPHRRADRGPRRGAGSPGARRRRPRPARGAARIGGPGRGAGGGQGVEAAAAAGYIGGAGLPGASGKSSPGPISILRELALSGPWSGYLAPTCSSRPWEDDTPTAMAAPHLFPSAPSEGLPPCS